MGAGGARRGRAGGGAGAIRGARDVVATVIFVGGPPGAKASLAGTFKPGPARRADITGPVVVLGRRVGG